MVALAAMVGTLLLLVVVAVTRSEQVRPDHGLVSERGMPILLLTVFIAVALPVLVLAATAGRLSAAMRDRRLANLRLLGLSPGLTRLVAVVETGVAAVAGTLAGWVAFLLLRPLLALLHPAGRSWSAATLHPHWRDYLVVVLLVPLAVAVVSAVPQRTRPADALALARRSTDFRPRWWRLAPLLVGFALTTYVLVGSDSQRSNERFVPYMFAGILLLGTGVIATVPVLVRLVADVLVRRTEHPALVIAGRRLQAQPAAMTRVVAGLLVGLFVVTGARAVVVAFEQTGQYQSDVLMKQTGMIASLETSARHAAAARRALGDVDQIRATALMPTLAVRCPGASYPCLQAVVTTCAELREVFGKLPGCRDDRPMWLIDPELLPRSLVAGPSLEWRRQARSYQAEGPAVSVPAPGARLDVSDGVLASLNAEVLVPPTTPGIQALLDRTRVTVLAVARKGVDLATHDRLLIPALTGFGIPDSSYYDFVAGLRGLVWAIGSMILSVGLLAFGIAATDRAMSRRREVTSLQLVGVSARVLRRVQWVEATLPLVLGIVLSVGLGALAGASYLAFGNEANAVPWPATLLIAAVSLAGSVVVAGLTVVAASPGIRAELIRSE